MLDDDYGVLLHNQLVYQAGVELRNSTSQRHSDRQPVYPTVPRLKENIEPGMVPFAGGDAERLHLHLSAPARSVAVGRRSEVVQVRLSTIDANSRVNHNGDKHL